MDSQETDVETVAGNCRGSDSNSRPLRVVFCWAEVTGYMAACWKMLAQRGSVDLHVIHPQRFWGKVNPFHSDPDLLQGVSNEMFDSERSDSGDWLLEAVLKRRPDVVVICGWIYMPYCQLVCSNKLSSTRVILGMDSPWRGTLKQRLARYRLARLVKRVNLVVTTGNRSDEYARRIGVPAFKLRSGYYGFDHRLFSAASSLRPTESGQWPRRFLFVGRYVPQKDLGTLIDAYSLYSRGVQNPWGLTCCGAGPDGRILRDVPGVTDAGFTQPKDLQSVFARHGVFLLPSRFEPWGVVLGEAAASGLPLICSSACGAGSDMVRPYYNGLVFAPQDVGGLARAMRWMHDHHSELPMMGARSQVLSESYSAEFWAQRWHNYLLETLEQGQVGVVNTLS